MQSRLEDWRKQHGGCLICGQPVAAPQFSIAVGGRILMDETNGNNEESVLAMDTDGRLLTEECPVRICLMRFNALAQYHASHIVDRYTLLPETANAFRDQFRKKEAALMQANPQAMASFKAHVVDSPSSMYDEAVALGKRMVNTRTVCACMRCNMAMKREAAHATAIYRCFSVTRNSKVPTMEGADTQATEAKKLVQQIALYFSPLRSHAPNQTSTIEGWSVKTDRQLVVDAALWRCIAHLQEWGRLPIASGVRQRLVAIFHASHYVYLSSSLGNGRMAFATWHIHVWRPFYMAHYNANTFFGMRQAEVARLFDFAFQNGERWEEALKVRLSAVVDELETRTDSDALLLDAMKSEETMAEASIVDERDMLRFLVRLDRRAGFKTALDTAWRFFRYCLGGGTSTAFLMRQCDSLTREMARVLIAPTITVRPPP